MCFLALILLELAQHVQIAVTTHPLSLDVRAIKGANFHVEHVIPFADVDSLQHPRDWGGTILKAFQREVVRFAVPRYYPCYRLYST